MGRSTRVHLIGYSLVALSCGAVACAASGGGDGGDSSTGGSPGLVDGTGGGIPGATGGAPGGIPGATGGAPGGDPGATGGAPGGDPGATGGSSGAAEITCTGTGWSFDGGYVDDGVWCGYAFTASWNTATVEPAEFGSGDTELCVSGTVPAESEADSLYPGLSVGFGVKQDRTNGNIASNWIAAGSGISFDITVAGAATEAGTIRIQVKTVGGPTDGWEYWLPANTGSGTISATWAQLSDTPWTTGGNSPAVGDQVTQVGVAIGGRESGPQTITNFCINGAGRI